MNTNEEIVFKRPDISKEDDTHKSQTIVTSVSQLAKEEAIPRTVLPEPMTALSPPEGHYFIDQLKNGVIVEHKAVVKSRIVLGRAQDCDVVLEHPSVSRYHCVLLWSPLNDQQFKTGENRESFWYLVDCGSTHGTNCNKTQITAGKTIKLIPNNNVFKLGASTRLFTLGTTLLDDDEEDNSTPELKDKFEDKNNSNNKSKSVDIGCNWGINEDQIDDNIEETADSKSLQAIIAAMKSTGSGDSQTDNSNAYSSNPNKCIQQWFEREGYDLEFKCDSIHNKFKSTLELPIDGQWIPVEGSLMHKKKEAISDVCLKCCQLLDRAQLLFPWQQKTQAIRRKQEEDDDSDSEMIDETVPISKKRVKRDSESDSDVNNFDTLNKKWSEINEQICQLRVKMANIGLKKDELPVGLTSDDSLDEFMANISHKKYGLSMNDKIEKSNLKMKINLLIKEQQKLEKLIKIAKPLTLSHSIDKIEPKVVEPIATTETVSKQLETNQTDPLTQTNDLKTETIDDNHRKDEIKRKTESVLNDLKKSSKQQNIGSNPKSSKHRFKAQSIVEAIEKEKKSEKTNKKDNYDTDYVDWLPPTDQSGDGKTSLNDKLGY